MKCAGKFNSNKNSFNLHESLKLCVGFCALNVYAICALKNAYLGPVVTQEVSCCLWGQHPIAAALPSRVKVTKV